MKCTANACRRKSYKNHKWTEEYTHGIYVIRYWRLRRKTLDNNNTLNEYTQILQLFADKSGLLILHNSLTSIATCNLIISSTMYHIKQEIVKKAQYKEQYRIDLASDIIYRRYRQLSPSSSLSDKIERADLIERNLKHTSEANARRNLFNMLRFDIKGFIDLIVSRGTLSLGSMSPLMEA
jgi:hypothetical protein